MGYVASVLYGPPPDALEIPMLLVLPEAWPMYLLCLVLGLGLSALALIERAPEAARAAIFVLGQVVLLTAPLAAALNWGVYGSFPTPDKNGQLQFYLRGVHKSLYLHPIDALQDPAVKLIGVHAGHQWVTEFFDLFLQGYGAFNAQALFWPALGWFAAALLLRELSGSWRTALTFAMPFGMGLHVFRDLNWHTIEKTSVGLLALFAWSLLRAWRRGGPWRLLPPALFLLMALDNLYLALVGGVGAAMVLGLTWAGAWRAQRAESKGPQSPVTLAQGRRRLWSVALAVGLSALALLPLGLYQMALLQGISGKMADPQAYLYERAMLDTLSLWPLQWNHLELWRALNLPLVGLSLYVAWRDRRRPLVQLLALLALGFTLLALGPQPLGVWSPLYMALRLVPGLWRLATPEVFFQGGYLALLALASLGPKRAVPLWGYPLMVIGWALVVHTHPAFPGFSELVEVPFSDSWVQRLGI